MTITDAAKNADCFAIESKRQAPTLSFLYYLLQALNEKAFVISGFEKKYFSKMTAAKKIQGIDSYINVMNLRSDWKINKQRYRYNLIYQELESIILKSDQSIVVLHSIGDFFEFQDGNEVETFVDKIISICTQANKKLIYTLDTDQALASIISKAFHNHIDIEISVTREDNQHALVNINHSIESIKYNSYRFFMPEADRFVFEPHLSTSTSDEVDKNENIAPRIILAGDGTQSLERISYLLDKELFDIEIVEASMATILTKLMSNPHILIYATTESFHDETHYELCVSAKEQKLQTSIIYITGSEFIRNSDKRAAAANFCGDVFEQNFNIEVFVTSLEKILKIPFYSGALKAIDTPNKIIELNEFSQYREKCIKSRIFFTQLIYKYKNSAPDEKALESILSRFGDCATIVHSEQKIILLLLNTSMNQVDVFNEKMKKLDNKNIFFLEGSESVLLNE